VYDTVFKTGKNLMDDLYGVLGLSDDLSASQQGSIVALNTLPWPRNEVLDLPSGQGVTVACSEGTLLTSVTPFAAATIPEVSVKQVDHDLFVLENAQLRVEILGGVITSLFDRRAQREIIAKGSKANQFVIFDDKPLAQQAWVVEVFHLDSRKELPNSLTKIGDSLPHRVSVVTETKISSLSWIRTTISLSAATEGDSHPPLVEVTADVEWHETMKFLKVEFPVNIRNTEASYEMQYGIVKRPTHYNTR
jgi:alpha-mannosidase